MTNLPKVIRKRSSRYWGCITFRRRTVHTMTLISYWTTVRVAMKIGFDKQTLSLCSATAVWQCCKYFTPPCCCSGEGVHPLFQTHMGMFASLVKWRKLVWSFEVDRSRSASIAEKLPRSEDIPASHEHVCLTCQMTEVGYCGMLWPMTPSVPRISLGNHSCLPTSLLKLHLCPIMLP